MFSPCRALVVAVCAMLCGSAQAHNPDTSYLRCVVTRHALELRFTFDIATLFRITKLDSNHDGRVTRGELERAAPVIFQYLGESVKLEVNGLAVPPGIPGSVVWPADGGAAIAEKDYSQQLVQFPVRVGSQPVIEDFSITYDIFDELGDNHRAVSDIEQDGRHLEVAFTLFEPDYLYDTGWKQEPTSSAAEPQSFAPQIRFRLFIGELWNAPRLMVLMALLVATVTSWRVVVALLIIFVFLSWGTCVFRCHLGNDMPWSIAALASITSVLLAGFLFYPLRIFWKVFCRWKEK